MLLANLLFAIAIGGPAADTTLPPLHTLEDKKIDSVTNNDAHETITVWLNSGEHYVYAPTDWDMEDDYPATPNRIKDIIRWYKKVFTKAEVMPSFPGGDAAWKSYLHEFCSRHSAEIQRAGASEFSVYGCVHLKGQIVNVRIANNPGNSDLAPLAVKAVEEFQQWVPAQQNGRPVVAYMIVKFRLE